jgi:hypothetical protein
MWTLPVIADRLREGLTARDYEALALVAHAHGMTIATLMRLALESEGER